VTAAVETLVLTSRDVAELLPMTDCIEAVEAAFRAQAAGDVLPSGVLALHAPAGGFHVKAAGLRHDRLYVAVKVNANFPGNPERRGLPTIQGLVVLHDGEDGRPLALMDSAEITALRTAAATGVAARHMALPGARTAALVGCGVQALHQIRALAAVRRLERVFVHDVDPERAATLAARATAELGVSVVAVEDLLAAVRQSQITVTCTPSTQPLGALAEVAAGAFVAGVGADNPSKHELPPALLARGRVVVDSLDQAAVMGDLHHALRAGAVRREDVHAELWEVASGRKPGRVSEDEVTVFDSTGVALEDVAAAALVFERAVASGRGRLVDFAASV
jgi:alanine dehydrogenase